MSRDVAWVQTCTWCGLPLPRPWRFGNGLFGRRAVQAADSSPQPAGEQYCCFGCRFAAQVTSDRGESGQVRWTLTRLGIALFFAMNVSMFTMALWSHDVYDVDPADKLATAVTSLCVWLSFVCSVPVLLLLGVPIAVSAWLALRAGRITTDLLVMAGVVAAFAYSVIAVLTGSSHIYFEVASLVLVLVTLGRWLEASGKLQTTEVLETLERLLPEQVRLIQASGEESVPTQSLLPGDCIRVLPGERLPADGVVENQAATIDEQILTGESVPVTKAPGAAVSSGTLNLDAELIVRVTRTVGDGAVARLLQAMQEARQSQGYYQRLADQVTTWFVPIVGVAAALTIILHLMARGPSAAILAGLAVVLIACPCALGLATSVATWTALGRAAERRVLIRSGETLERLAHIKAICFDKTGTLTTGTAHVVEFVTDKPDERDELLAIAVALAQRSSHSYSRAISEYQQGFLRPTQFTGDRELTAVRSHAGCGMSGQLADGERVWLGRREWLQENDCHCPLSLHSLVDDACDRQATVFLGCGSSMRGVFRLNESLRPEVTAVAEACERLGLRLFVLSGDRPERAASFAQQTGIPTRGGLLPEQKLAALRRLRQQIGPVMMVGDGINDAPALAAADVGVALGCGTDVSRDAASVCLLANDLSAIPWTIELGRMSRRVILQNLAWAFGYNGIGMSLAAVGLLNPVVAAIVMFASSLMVLANSRRLKNFESAVRSADMSETPAVIGADRLQDGGADPDLEEQPALALEEVA